MKNKKSNRNASAINMKDATNFGLTNISIEEYPKIIYLTYTKSIKYIRYDEHLKLKRKLKRYENRLSAITFDFHQT